jgi:hypothetical protein
LEEAMVDAATPSIKRFIEAHSEKTDDFRAWAFEHHDVF